MKKRQPDLNSEQLEVLKVVEADLNAYLARDREAWERTWGRNDSFQSIMQCGPLQIANGYEAFQKNVFAAMDAEPGGTGEIFDWQKVKDIERPFLLAGGLRPENICEAIQTVAPFGFDVSSGIESEPGKKDSEKLQKFCQFARESEVFCP